MFNKLFLEHTDNVQINYYLAMNAINLKLYDDATAAFERVLIKKPDFHRARLEYARVLLILGFKEEAKKEFLKVSMSPIPENVRINIQKYLEQIDNTSSSTFISLSLGMMYDDNINSGIDYDTYNLPGFGNFQVNGTPPQSSSSYIASFMINHLHSLNKNSKLFLKHTGYYFYKNQTVNDTYNFNFLSYKPTLYYNDSKNKAEYSLQLGIEDILPGDNLDFIAYSIMPAYKKIIDKDNSIDIFTQYKDIHYSKQEHKTRNYAKKGLGVSWDYKKLKYSLSYEKDSRDFGTRTDLNKKIITNSIAYNYDIQPSIILNTQFQYKQINYEDEDVLFTTKRKDISRNFYLGLTKVIEKRDFVTFSYTNTNNNSNQKAYTYDRNILSVNYTWRFKL
ncbi:tetratricopeptide repeat protein [Arcobacter sp.]|uniref:tetratricopeptide repeat protein n=1 Tax=Arcobacter sp. TaxID=1872629 RepID=UPI003D112E55